MNNCSFNELMDINEKCSKELHHAVIEEMLNIDRDGITSFVKWLKTETDFFTAPASTKYHGAKLQGLVEHSFNVFIVLNDLCKNKYPADTIALVSLFHDVCKANFYSSYLRNVKNEETGDWEKVESYKIDEQFPYGSHGGKSVYLLMSHGINLSDEEATAINCHMGGWDNTIYHNPNGAFTKYPLALYLHIADMMATYLYD